MVLVAIAIGTDERARDFVRETGFPVEHLYADPENVAYSALRLRKGWGVTFLQAATPFAIRDRLTKDGAAGLASVLPRWKPWLPPRSDQALNQGGAFVFRGTETLLAHYDEATGAHIPLTELLAAAGCGAGMQ